MLCQYVADVRLPHGLYGHQCDECQERYFGSSATSSRAATRPEPLSNHGHVASRIAGDHGARATTGSPGLEIAVLRRTVYR